MNDGGYSGAPSSLDALFKGKAKAKKKVKPVNFNAPPFKAASMAKGPAMTLRPPGGSAFTASTSSTEGWARELKKDQDLLKSCGLRVKEVEGDGACLFRAFADQLAADEPEAHARFREECVDFMEQNRADFEPFFDDEFESYCSRMRQRCTWGGHVEVQALARRNGVNAVIYQPSQASGRPDQILRSAVEIQASDEHAGCVQLSFHPTHHAGQHYNSVRCCTDEGSGPAELVSFGEIKRRIEDKLRPKDGYAEESEEQPDR